MDPARKRWKRKAFAMHRQRTFERQECGNSVIPCGISSEALQIYSRRRIATARCVSICISMFVGELMRMGDVQC